MGKYYNVLAYKQNRSTLNSDYGSNPNSITKFDVTCFSLSLTTFPHLYNRRKNGYGGGQSA